MSRQIAPALLAMSYLLAAADRDAGFQSYFTLGSPMQYRCESVRMNRRLPDGNITVSA